MASVLLQAAEQLRALARDHDEAVATAKRAAEVLAAEAAREAAAEEEEQEQEEDEDEDEDEEAGEGVEVAEEAARTRDETDP